MSKPKKRKLNPRQRRFVKAYTDLELQEICKANGWEFKKGKMVDAETYAKGLGEAAAKLLKRAGEARTSLR
ncbi:hypothetical protein LCGC14_0776800 [marine sediment metagenome]|uniref:Uncharacterized protein n=1 Tax=marine sediment metagenome TaxID=412755 RepID=A0A0F9SGN7_9ZZZZ